MNSIHLAVHLIRRTLSSKRSIFTYLLLPSIIVAVVISIMGNMGTQEPVLAYTNLDKGTFGASMLRELENGGNVKLVRKETAEAARHAVSDSKAYAAVIIPETFSENVLQSEPIQVELIQMRIDGTAVSLKLRLEQAAGGIIGIAGMVRSAGIQGIELENKVEQVLAEREKRSIGAQVTDLGLYVNPAVSTATGMLFLFMLTLVNSSVGIMVDERHKRTLSRIYTAPVRAYEIAAGNLLGSFFLGAIQTIVVLAISRYGLGFDYGVGFWMHLLIILFFLLSAMGIGCAIASLVRNPDHLSSINSLVVTPTCMIGGCFWPIELTPEFMQKLSHIVPQRWAIDALQRLAAGEALPDIALNLVILALFAVVLLGFGSIILRPNEAAN